MTTNNKSINDKTHITRNRIYFLIPIVLGLICTTGCKSKITTTTTTETTVQQPESSVTTAESQAEPNKPAEETTVQQPESSVIRTESQAEPNKPAEETPNTAETKTQMDAKQPSDLANAPKDDEPKPSTVPLNTPWKCAAERCRLSIDNPDILIPKNAIADGNIVRCGSSELDYSPVLESVADQLEDENHAIDLYGIVQVIPGSEMINLACEDEHFVCQKDNCSTSVNADESYTTKFSIDDENSEYIIGHEPFDISLDIAMVIVNENVITWHTEPLFYEIV